MGNETKIIEDLKEWLEEREKEQQVLTNLFYLANDLGTGWEHWLKYELALMLSESLDSEYEVCLEKTVDIDGRGLGGTTTKRIDLVISQNCDSDQNIQLIELKVGWLTEKEIDDYIGNNLNLTRDGEDHYLLDMYYLNKVKNQSTKKCRGTFIFCFFATTKDDDHDNPVPEDKVKKFLEKYKNKLRKFAGLEHRQLRLHREYVCKSLYLAEFSISI